MDQKKILVVMGGTSSEREVSLRSGDAMLRALLEKGYRAEGFVLNENNVAGILEKKPDCVVLALHGKGGEDGSIQGMLELAGIPYTGSKVASSSVCMDKILAKKILAYDGIRTADFLAVSPGDPFDPALLAETIVSRLGLPTVVKAPCQGSSVGIEIIRKKEDLPASLERVYRYDGELLIEAFLPGKELTVPVIKKREGVATLPVIEIVSENSFYDYESKYTAGMSHHIIPARISGEIRSEVEGMAVAAYRSLNCDGLVRVDFILGADEKPYLMEINTLPGMTGVSLVPDAARAVGIAFPDLVAQLVELALRP